MKPPDVSQSLRCDVSVNSICHEPQVGAFSRYHNLLLAVWLDKATGAAATKLSEAAQGMFGSGLEKISVVHWLTPHRGLPEQAVRQQLVEVLKSLRSQVVCTSVILNSSGFWAGSVRAMVSGMRLLSPNRSDLRIDGNATDTCTWLPEAHTRQTGFLLTAEALNVALEMAVRDAVILCECGDQPGRSAS